jgi:hypothetical protein
MLMLMRGGTEGHVEGGYLVCMTTDLKLELSVSYPRGTYGC